MAFRNFVGAHEEEMTRIIEAGLLLAGSFRVMSAFPAVVPACERHHKQPDFRGGEASGTLTSMPFKYLICFYLWAINSLAIMLLCDTEIKPKLR